MPREIAILGTGFPALVVLFLAGAALTWLLDSVLARVGVYRAVWHPSLFRVSVLVIVCCALGLAVYR